MNDLLITALASIERESPKLDASFELVDRLLLAYGEHELAERLFSAIDETVDWRTVAVLFSMLQWSTSDNGQAIRLTTERWLRDCDSERKVSIALSLDTYPFSDAADMRRFLEIAATRFPAVASRCEALLESRK